MTVAEIVLATVPRPYRALVYKHRELLKFCFVGGIAWVVDAGGFALLNQWFFGPMTAKTISLTLAGIVSYYLSRAWAFRTRGGHARHREIILFVVITGIAALVNEIPLWITHYAMNIQVPNVSFGTMKVVDFVSANIVGTAVGFVIRFWGSKRFAFPDADVRNHPDGSEAAAEADLDAKSPVDAAV